MNTNEALEALNRTARTYLTTRSAHEAARKATHEAALAALRAGVAPTEVARRSPYTEAHVRKLARAAGIPPRQR
jgi:hypothetical protein